MKLGDDVRNHLPWKFTTLLMMSGMNVIIEDMVGYPSSSFYQNRLVCKNPLCQI